MKAIEQRLLEFASQRDWEAFHKPKDLAISVCIEAAELLEIFQWRNGDKPITEVERENIASEAADVLQYLILLCSKLGIDLEAAVQSKIQRNEKRFPVNIARGIAKPPDQTE